MEDAVEVQRAVGRYRSPRFDLIVGTCAGIIWIGIGVSSLSRSSVAVLWIATGIAVITIVWLVPVVVINMEGVWLPRKFKFLPWVQVTKVFQPGPGDPVRIELSSGKRVVLSGVGPDRFPGIVALASKHVVDTAEPATGHEPDQV